jgi:hypothetical protein
MIVCFFIKYEDSKMEMNQLQTEKFYSKTNTNSIIMDDLNSALPLQMYMDINTAITKYRTGEYYNSKRVRITKLATTEKIIRAIFCNILLTDRQRPIQDPATAIGFAVGMDNPVDAVKTGAELLAVTADTNLFDILMYSDGTEIKPKLIIEDSTRNKLNTLQFLPPCKEQPQDWINNTTGGWLFEHKSVLLGNGNHHEGYQALDALNALQSVPWTIDADVLINEKDTNTNMNQEQFLTIASEYIGSDFYFVWRYDKRGRSYSSGYDLNIQSNEYGKALLSLSNQVHVTNIDNLKIAIANHAGHDKMTWSDRIDWFDKQNDQFETADWDEPILGRKAINAYQDTINGESTGYVMSLDATASGLQIMSALTGCIKTARACNMINTGKREDLYTMISDEMNTKLSLVDYVDRKLVKQPIMTHYYNSKVVPAEAFNEAQLDVFYKVLDNAFEGAEALMETVNSFWNYDTDVHTWTLPDGHVARVPVVEMADTRIEVDELEHRTFTYRYAKQQPSTNFKSLVANIIHSVDGYIAREMVRRSTFDLVHIHDCFVFSPEYMQDVSQLYRLIMVEIADSNLLSDILSEIRGEYIEVNKLTNTLSAEIAKSEYMLS